MNAITNPEIGRELKVSELQRGMIVWLWKEGRAAIASVWVEDVGKVGVWFRAGAVGMEFLAERCGPGLEEITDSDRLPMKVFEYRGKP